MGNVAVATALAVAVATALAVATVTSISVSVSVSISTAVALVSFGFLASAGSLLVVARAQEPAVRDVGLAAVAVFDDVVDLAAFGIDVAGRMRADAVADLDGSAEESFEEPVGAGHVHRLAGGVEDDAFEVGFGQPVGNVAPRQDGAVERLAYRAHQVFGVDHHRDERSRDSRSRFVGAGPAGHLDQGISAALGDGAAQVGAAGVVAVDLAGLGPVGFEQFVVDVLPLGLHDQPICCR
ncbi:MAG: hypothetical protein GX643_14665 [Acidimicrobiales bacterium]|nr:hypothetical protein [Acidimicrobiales bacterium]